MRELKLAMSMSLDSFVSGDLAHEVNKLKATEGKLIFAGLPAPRPLKLVGSRAFPRGTVAQFYRPL
jgi:hypothetical protein